MWAVYLCGCTDCFLAAMFKNEEQAEAWAKLYSNNPEGYTIRFWPSPTDIDKSDTGWKV